VTRVLVTGGAGFIGSNLVQALLERGDEVRVLDNFSTGSRRNLAALGRDVEVVEGDLRSYERVHTAVRGAEVVFHQGALGSVPRSVQDPLTSTAVNVEGTLNVLLAARDEGIRRVVAASSSSVYGDGGTFPRVETQAPNPLSPYAVAKLAAERFCVSFSRVYGLETVALRYFNVFGPRQDPTSQYAAVVPRFIRAVASGRPVTVYGDGEQSREHARGPSEGERDERDGQGVQHVDCVLDAAGGDAEHEHAGEQRCRDRQGPLGTLAEPGSLRSPDVARRAGQLHQATVHQKVAPVSGAKVPNSPARGAAESQSRATRLT